MSSDYVRADGTYGSYDPGALDDESVNRLIPVEGVATLRAWVKDWPEKPHGNKCVGSIGVMLKEGTEWPQTFMEIDAYLPLSASDSLHRMLGSCKDGAHFFTMTAHAASADMKSRNSTYGDSEYQMKDGELYSASFYQTRFSAQAQRLEYITIEGGA
jgi:hypothetical protein